ncbi:unnamed protein product [Gordionus sp. m RMFG-2023]
MLNEEMGLIYKKRREEKRREEEEEREEKRREEEEREKRRRERRRREKRREEKRRRREEKRREEKSVNFWGGWLCFIFAIIWIGILTAVIGDIASAFGCTIGLKDTVTAISFVALGTSVPDTFASKLAALQDEYADASIGNVTGSNAVNVFLGIGLAWALAAIYHSAKGTLFMVDPGSLAFSVTIYCVLAVVAIAVLMVKRSITKGELGGPMMCKVITGCIFFTFWLIYLVLASLESYCHIKGF